MSYTVAKVELKGDLSGLNLGTDGVLNAVLVGSPITFNGVNYNDTFQHKLLVTNQVESNNTMINLRTVNTEYGNLQTTALLDKLILTNQDLFDALVGAGKLITSVTKPADKMGKAFLDFFYDSSYKINVYKVNIFL